MNLGAAILILKMKENMQHFRCIMLYYFKKGKHATEMQKKICAAYGEGAATDWTVRSGLWSFLVLLIFRPNNSLLWGCLVHWQMFTSTPGLCPLEANTGREPTSSKYKSVKLLVKMKNVSFILRKKLKELFGQPSTLSLPVCSVSGNRAFHLHRSLPPDSLQLHVSCLETNNCSERRCLASVPAKRPAGKISFPLPSTAAGELLLPVSVPSVSTTPRCGLRSAFPSLPPFAFLWKVVLRRDGFPFSLGVL